MSTQPKMQSLDQRRAAHAHEWLSKFVREHMKPDTKGKNQPDSDAKKYGVHVRRLPMRIMASGLGQAMAFLLAKNYCPELLLAVSDWVLYARRNESRDSKVKAEPRELLLELIKKDSEYAQLATAEVLAYLRWLTRFAEAEKMAGDGTVDDAEGS